MPCRAGEAHLTDIVPQHQSCPFQYLVPDIMTMGVVDMLEVIKSTMIPEVFMLHATQAGLH